MQVFSFGGGVQSTAALVLATQGRIAYRTFLFANVGAQSENPATLTYLRDVARPYATSHGLEIIEIAWVDRKGRQRDLFDTLVGDSRSIPIPVYMKNGAPGRRTCTADYKRAPIARWLKQQNTSIDRATGATSISQTTLGLGISLDEFQRMRTESGFPHIIHAYPLIELRLSRMDCHRIITAAGLPTPPKSACWFCPFHTHQVWRDMERNQPVLFGRAIALEQRLNERRATLGKDAITLSSTGKPLKMLPVTQTALFEPSACDGGYCGL